MKMKNNNIKSTSRTALLLLLLFLVNLASSCLNDDDCSTRWPNLDHKTTWDYSKTMENAWFVMAICE